MRHQNREAGSLYTQSGLRKYLTPQERARLIAVAWVCPRAELKAFCLTLAFTGCRVSEALALCGHSIEPESGFVAIRSLKRRKREIVMREIPVPNVLTALLMTLQRQPGDRLWSWSRSQAWRLMKALMTEATIQPGPHATPRGLRHGFGIHAVRSGVPLNLVQRWLGHASMMTTAIYLQAMGDEERELAARMWVTSQPTVSIRTGEMSE